MNNSQVLNTPVNQADKLTFRLNCEFLQNCKYHCSGCYVTRKNNFDNDQLYQLHNIIELFRDNNTIFDELILGPTDFFAATNTIELLNTPQFIEIFKYGDVVLTILTTLQSDDTTITQLIDIINQNLSNSTQEMEILIVMDLQRIISKDQSYINHIKHKLNILDTLNPTFDYAMQMNIQDLSKFGNITLPEIAQYIKQQLNTVVEFNPSFLRTKNNKFKNGILSIWNNLINSQINQNNKSDIIFTMANQFHAGFNEITFNFHQGDLYLCPFIYENVFDKSSAFKIPKINNKFYTWNDIVQNDIVIKSEMFKYLPQTTYCSNCLHQMSCVSKYVPYFMQQYNITDCIVAKDVIDLYQ